VETPAGSRPDTVSIRDDVVYRELDGDIVALSISSGEYVSLDSIGSDIWRFIERFGSIAQVKSALLADYDLDEPTCDAEVAAFVATLQAKGLVTCAPR